MAKQPSKKERRKHERQAQVRFVAQSILLSDEWWNGGGCSAYEIKCESCELVQPGGEKYPGPCRCGHEIALYEPQLRQ